MINSFAFNTVGVPLALYVIIHATPGRAQVYVLHEYQRLMAPELENDDRFGGAVAISGDSAFVGAPLNDNSF